MLKLAYILRNLQTSRAINSRILRIGNVKFSGYCFNMNTHIQRDFQICISVPLIKYKKQRNLVVNLNKNCKKEFFDILEIKNNSKFFWDTQQTFALMKTSGRRLSPWSSEYFFSRSSRPIDQGVFRRRQIYSCGHKSSRRLQDVFKTSCQHVLKTSCKDVFKTFSRRVSKLNCFC